MGHTRKAASKSEKAGKSVPPPWPGRSLRGRMAKFLFSLNKRKSYAFPNVILIFFFDDKMLQFSSVQSLSRVRLFVTPWIAAHQASLSITNSRSPPKLMCIESVMPSTHLILCHPLLLPPIPPSIRVFSNESTLHPRWPKLDFQRNPRADLL